MSQRNISPVNRSKWLRVFKNRVQRRIFGPKRDEVTRGVEKKYYSDDQIEKNEMGGRCSTYGERRGIYRVVVGKPE
jgi:hypothetical protein